MDRHRAVAASYQHIGQRAIDYRHPHDDGHRGLQQHLLVDYANRMVHAGATRSRPSSRPRPTASSDFDDIVRRTAFWDSLPLALGFGEGN